MIITPYRSIRVVYMQLLPLCNNLPNLTSCACNSHVQLFNPLVDDKSEA